MPTQVSTIIKTTVWFDGNRKVADLVDVGNGIDRALIVYLTTDRGGLGRISTLTYNGISMTPHGSSQTDGQTGSEWQLFSLPNPPAGSHTLEATFTAGADLRAGWIATVVNGADQVNPLRDFTYEYATSTGYRSISQASTFGDLVCLNLMTYDSGGLPRFTPGTNFTERYDDYWFAMDGPAANAASTTVDWTSSIGTGALWRAAVFVVKPASAPATRKVIATVVTSPADSTPRANLSGIKWAWFDQITPDLFATPTDKGTAEVTDGSGVIEIPLPNSAKANGEVGFLIITNSDGTPTQSPAAYGFAGPLAVTVS